MKTVGLFSGVAGFEEGLRRSGLSTELMCEIDPVARRVLERRFPDVEVAHDIRELSSLPRVDVVGAGFPCQDLSQAGRAMGISGGDSGLVREVFRLLASSKPRPGWVVLENVPFMLHLAKGHAMAVVTRGLEDLGYRWAYRVVDSIAFGLPQRRRRVLIVAGRGRDPRSVLFADDAGDREQLCRADTPRGFYWTEGRTGVGWARNAVPPLKGGSGLGIPSSPGIWFPDRRLIGTLDIRDAERLQGLRSGWTRPADDSESPVKHRWRLVGNAVSVPLATWLGGRLREPGKYDASNDEEWESVGTWPSAAWGEQGRRFVANVSTRPVKRKYRGLRPFLRYKVKPLSIRAAQGVSQPCTGQQPNVRGWIPRRRNAPYRSDGTWRGWDHSGQDRRLIGGMAERPGRPAPSSADVSRRMAATGGKDNDNERRLRSELHRRGLRFRIHQCVIPGSRRSVDIAFPRARLAVLVDGCFWHGCPIHGTQPKSNSEWWRRKIRRNVERDRDTNRRLRELGWSVLRVWEHENPTNAADRIVEAYRDRLGDC